MSDDDVRFLLQIYAMLNLNSNNALKQESTGFHAASHVHMVLIPTGQPSLL